MSAIAILVVPLGLVETSAGMAVLENGSRVLVALLGQCVEE